MKTSTYIHLAVGATLALPLSSSAESSQISQLDPTVVTAHRWETPTKTVGNSLTQIDIDSLRDSGIYSLSSAVMTAPGLSISGTGARGGATSLFIRGTESDHSQIVVDGLRVSDANILPAPFLGGASLAGFGTLEILRGPQAAAYGGEAIGGVIALSTEAGEEGATKLETTFEGGSFNTFIGSLEATGSLGAESTYRFTLSGETTDNDRANNRFEQAGAAARIDQNIGDGTLTLTLRIADRSYGSPGSIHQNNLENTDSDETVIATAAYVTDINDYWTSKLLIGGVSQRLRFDTPAAQTGIDSTKFSADWRNELTVLDNHRTILGVATEFTDVDNSGFGAINENETLIAVYADHLVELADGLNASVGVRREDYDTFGSATTFRGSVSYALREGTKLKASIGSAFRAPSFFDLYAVDDFFVGNPELDAEESLGWDLGIEQDLGTIGAVSLTYFRNEIDDLITSDFSVSPSTQINLDSATTSGVELSLAKSVSEDSPLSYRIAYTYLEAEDDTTGARLLRRPKHLLSGDIALQATSALRVGIGGTLMNDREDIDASTFATIAGDDFFIARAYATYAATDNIDLHLRVENLLDEEYDEIDGFPGLPFSVFAGATVRF